jgi:ADP-ribose pyrophosphatase YjhB (NUDIX family)
MSVFAIIRRDAKVLLVKPKDHPRWKEEWSPNWGLYDSAISNEYKSWRFPSSYIREGESPDETLARLIKDQLEVASFDIVSSKLLNFYEPSRRYPDRMHWDYCFVYEIKLNSTPTLRPWYSSLEYVDLKSLDPKDFGSAQGGLLNSLV